jgi:hypothetical protein
MTLICRFIAMAVTASVSLRAAPLPQPDPLKGPAEIRPAQVEITGSGFQIQEMRMNSLAFNMRDYIWIDVPKAIEGLRYTQMEGGGTATIHLKAKEAGRVFAAVAASRMLDLKEKGWMLPIPDRSNTFTYTDVNHMMMVILSRKVTSGEELDIPQLGWQGTIVLLPAEGEDTAN